MIRIDPFNQDRYEAILGRWDRIAKPIRGLGVFEEMIARIGAVRDTEDVDISRRAVIMMIADNGIVEEGVSQSGQEVTASVAEWMGRGISSVCHMARAAGADTIPVDIGINTEGTPRGVIDRKVMKGTRNFMRKPAMTVDECMQAIDAGIDMVCECSLKGYEIIATGEMGIGNTTTSAALAAALLGLDAEDVTGRGAGLSDDGYKRKLRVIQDALDRYCYDEDEQDSASGGEDADGAGGTPADVRRSPEYVMEMLSALGGLDIAGLTGVFIGGAIYHIPVVIDGFISAVAALAAERLAPGTKEYMIASHVGRERGMRYVLDELGLRAVMDADLALGEGTGAVMLFSLLDTVLSLYRNMALFDETDIEQYEVYGQVQK